MEERRDWPLGRREHKWGLCRPKGLPIESRIGSAFTPTPRTLSILGIPPKTVEEASPKQGHHFACLYRDTEAPLLWLLELCDDRWRAVCGA
jgi:hypothetical protein